MLLPQGSPRAFASTESLCSPTNNSRYNEYCQDAFRRKQVIPLSNHFLAHDRKADKDPGGVYRRSHRPRRNGFPLFRRPRWTDQSSENLVEQNVFKPAG